MNLLARSAAAALLAVLPAAAARAGGMLHTAGQDIVDGDDHKVMLRGVGLGNWFLPEGYMWKFGKRGDRPRQIEAIVSDLAGPEYAAKFWADFRANYVTEKDVARIAELGFNSVRPALNARLFLTEGPNPEFREEGFRILDNLVGWCRAHHVYVIIDMHAAPGGQTGQNIDDSIDDDPGLWSKPENQDRLEKLWLRITTKYKDDPTVAAYDLLNEPLPGRTGAADKYKSQLQPLYQRLTKSIRATGDRHIITVEGYDWANNWSVFTAPKFDDNLVYQFHYYCWDKPTNLKGIDGYLARRDRLGAPVWVGETGEKDDAIYWGTTDYFESHNIGWSFWPWKKLDTNNAPYSINLPKDWDQIAAYSRDAADKPSRETAQRIFDEYLHNIRIENCTYNEDVVNALFHRAPIKLEAENYGHAGPEKSYHVNEPTTRATLYRKSEPVPVVEAEHNGQAVHLAPGEWTAYALNSPSNQTYTATIKLKPDHAPATVTLTVNGTPYKATATSEGWAELKLGHIPLSAGANPLRLAVDRPAAIDWIDVR